MKVGPEGGLATSLSTEAESVPFRFTNDLDIDEEGNIYFTDSSIRYQRRYLEFINFAEIKKYYNLCFSANFYDYSFQFLCVWTINMRKISLHPMRP